MDSVYKTRDLDLAAFLLLHDLKYLGLERIYEPNTHKEVAVLKFDDSKGIARDLSRVFITSSEKKYREFLKFLLKEIHKELSDRRE